MSESAELRIGDQTIQLPIIEGSEGERAIDITQAPQPRPATSPSTRATPTPAPARARSPSSTARRGSCATAASRSRSWPRRASFLEVAYLLIYGRAARPQSELEEFVEIDRTSTRCSTRTSSALFGALPKDAHPMAACSAAVGALATFYPDSLDPRDPTPGRDLGAPPDRQDADDGGLRLQALDRPAVHVPAERPRLRRQLPAHDVRQPCEDYEVDPVVEKAIDLLLHPPRRPRAELLDQHGATGRLLDGEPLRRDLGRRSTRSGGRCHGGANQEVIEMLAAIRDEGMTARQFVERAKSGDDSARLMGFGHRVYKNFDPRSEDHQEGLRRRAREAGHPQRAARDRRRSSRRSR